MTDTEPVTVPTDDDGSDDSGDRWRVWVGDTVTFELERGPRGMNAVRVKKA